ncbi:FHA domain-containing protein [Haliangium sp.]
MRTLSRRYAVEEAIGLCDVRAQERHYFADHRCGEVRKSCLVIGRDRRCDIQLADPSVSMLHCHVYWRDDGAYSIEDAQSTNGLFVNDIKVERAVLAPGMWVFLGRTELIVMGVDHRLPITATTNTSFLGKAARYYGSDRKASQQVGKSAATIGRARRRRLRRKGQLSGGDVGEA